MILLRSSPPSRHGHDSDNFIAAKINHFDCDPLVFARLEW
jgi:hypothetical protein